MTEAVIEAPLNSTPSSEEEQPEAPKPPIAFPGLDKRPKFVLLEDWLKVEDKEYAPGVYWCTIEKREKQMVPVNTRVCGVLKVVAQTRDAQHNNYGRLLRFQTTSKHHQTWAMPMELLAGSAEELNKTLMSMGLDIVRNHRAKVAEYIQGDRRSYKKKMICTTQVGWVGVNFVLPDQAFGKGADKVIFQSGEAVTGEYLVKGTLGGWKEQVALRARGNPLLMFAISTAFVGPLLAKVHSESGGVHFINDSSTGKTTLVKAACSVWGGPEHKRSWKATANGIEGVATLFNDNLLALDEINEADPREVGHIVYSLGNGTGKQRASRSGAARNVRRWRVFVISSGEKSSETILETVQQSRTAGQSVRLLNLPAERSFGAWDTLHGFADGAQFSDELNKSVHNHHGSAGREYLEKLTHNQRDFSAEFENYRSSEAFQPPQDAQGQERRAASRFALIAMAGELATEYGVTGWQTGEATESAKTAFELWRSQREAGHGNEERLQILQQLHRFIERHGDSRFSSSLSRDDGAVERVRDRAGWWRFTGEHREFLFNRDGLGEALKGYDFKRTLARLAEEKVLLPGSAGKNSQPVKVQGEVKRLYIVDSKALEEALAVTP